MYDESSFCSDLEYIHNIMTCTINRGTHVCNVLSKMILIVGNGIFPYLWYNDAVMQLLNSSGCVSRDRKLMLSEK